MNQQVEWIRRECKIFGVCGDSKWLSILMLDFSEFRFTTSGDCQQNSFIVNNFEYPLTLI